MKSKGFTLIELLVVVAIIGVLAMIVLSSLNNARIKARDAKRQQDVKTIQSALEIYYLDHGVYPTSNNSGGPPNNHWSNSATNSWSVLETRMGGITLPEDPTNQTGGWAAESGRYLNYSYYGGVPGCGGQGYLLVYRLEKGDTPSSESQGVLDCNGGTQKYGAGSITVGHSPRQ